MTGIKSESLTTFIGIRIHYPEVFFATIYSLFLLSCNYSGIVWSFSRLSLPMLPLYLFLLREWIPHDRRVLWGGAVLSALLASADLIHFRNVFGFKLP